MTIDAAAPGFELGDLYTVGLLFAGVTLLASVVALSRQAERAFTAAIVYLGFGVIAALGLNAFGANLLDPIDDAEVLEHLSELAVIVALFGAGFRLDRPLGWAAWSSTARLIGIVMPISIIAVAAFAGTAMGLSLGAAVILGAILSPTDPVLAADVQVGPPGEPDESEPHFALTSEAGLNDGLAFPFVILGIFIAGEGGTSWVGEWILADVVYAIAVGLAIGVAAGFGLGALGARLRESEHLHPRLDSWVAIAAVLTIYGATELVGAYGFVAAFASGLAFRRQESRGEHHERVHEGTEMVENVAELALVLLIGSTVTLEGLGKPGLAGWLVVPFLLLLVRPAATALAFAGSGVPVRERAMMGWLGIRGIGTVYYVAVVLGSGVLSDAEAQVVYWTAFACVAASVIAHGMSAAAVVRRMRPAA